MKLKWIRLLRQKLLWTRRNILTKSLRDILCLVSKFSALSLYLFYFLGLVLERYLQAMFSNRLKVSIVQMLSLQILQGLGMQRYKLVSL